MQKLRDLNIFVKMCFRRIPNQDKGMSFNLTLNPIFPIFSSQINKYLALKFILMKIVPVGIEI